MIAPTVQRVPQHTRPEYNRAIQLSTVENVATYSSAGPEAIERRLLELDQEWDMERTLEANAATLILTGFVLGSTVNRRWHLLSGVVAGFFLQHAIQGWCPPINLFRRWGLRTESEIDTERYALKALRGDFSDVEPLGEQRTRTTILRAIEAVNT